MELSLREVLGIAKKEFNDSIVDLVKRKRLSTETELERPMEVRTTHIDDMAMEDEWAENHYSRPHWARATTETPVKIGDVQEPVVALVENGSEINLISTRRENGRSTPSTGGRYERRRAPPRNCTGPARSVLFFFR